jgi:hypothetical protein
MYKLKEQYKGITVNKSGRMIILDNVSSNEVELLGVEHFFEKIKEKKSKPTDKIEKTL